jgi:hypothetical protein
VVVHDLSSKYLLYSLEFNYLLIPVLCLGPQHDGLLAESEGGDDSTKKSIKQTQEKIKHLSIAFYILILVELHCSCLSEREVKRKFKMAANGTEKSKKGDKELDLR